MTDPDFIKKNLNLPTLVLIGNYIPLLFCFIGLIIQFIFYEYYQKFLFVLTWIYLAPPAIARTLFIFWGKPSGKALAPKDTAFKIWWIANQLQVLHNRFPWLDEMLRMVPGLYSLWLNLWGSQASPFVYWAPGARIIDRYLVNVGTGAVIGMEAALAGHAGQTTATGEYVVDVDVVTVEQGAIMGARSGLGPGAVLAANEMLPAGRYIAPYTCWRGNKRYRIKEDHP